MKRTFALLLAAGVVAGVVGLFAFGPAPARQARLGIVSSVHAGGNEGCSLGALQGEYLITGRADTRSDVPDPTYPRVSIGVWNFDGEGGVTGFNTQSQGGVITRGSFTGTYAFDSSNCTATLELGMEPAHWDLFVTGDGSEGAAVRTDAGNIATRYIKRR
jgi:hypothetical protein